jgi:hypothetical protein
MLLKHVLVELYARRLRYVQGEVMIGRSRRATIGCQVNDATFFSDFGSYLHDSLQYLTIIYAYLIWNTDSNRRLKTEALSSIMVGK